MTITASSLIRITEFPEFEDPSLPAGTWVGNQVVTGDVSGGSRIVQLIIAPVSQPKTSLFYSLEQFMVFDEDSTVKTAQVQGVNLGRIGTLSFDQIIVVEMLALPVSGSGGLGRDLLGPYQLGRQRTGGVATQVRASVNNSDGDDFIFQAQGYWWDARSVSAPGGPSRPVQGMYQR